MASAAKEIKRIGHIKGKARSDHCIPVKQAEWEICHKIITRPATSKWISASDVVRLHTTLTTYRISHTR